MSNMLKIREVYKPFEYPKAFDFMKLQQNNFWLPSEVSMTQDKADWKSNLTDSERRVLSQILKSFIQTEIHVNEYWSSRVSKWFPKPEIQMMAATFAAFESIHQEGYDYLNVELDITDYSAFLQDKEALAKLARLKEVKGNKKEDIARSLAIFSGLTEGVNLYSAFAILANMSRFGYMMGLKNIIAWSQRDEDIHSAAGCWLFREFIKENPEIWTKDFKKDIYDAARLSVELEDNFIDSIFSLGEIRGLDPKDLKNFIRNQANEKLIELGLKTNWKNLDQESLERMGWFNTVSNGISNVDFFSSKETQYSRVNFSVENMFDKDK
jgi:ribonucleoside-diphosphate reductase beta chain